MAQVLVTRTYLPELSEYTELLEGVWHRGQVTNNGPLLQELEDSLVPHHGTDHVLLVGNGTIALQLALRALDITGEVITTPYSYVASTTAILWEHCTPVHVDIDPVTFCIDPARIEAAITPRTQAILATHVYGLPCDVDAIATIARRHGLKVIYDGAHAFGTTHQGRPLLSYGDISTCSFHATKIYHTVEGGSIACHDEETYRKLRLLRAFGHIKDDHFLVGINGKNSELHAAMGVLMLRHMPSILERRKAQWWRYAEALQGCDVQLARVPGDTDYNHAYFPAIMPSEAALHALLEDLAKNDIHPRRYFYPSLTELPYLSARGTCPIAEDLARRALCLPLFHQLDDALIDRIALFVRSHLK